MVKQIAFNLIEYVDYALITGRKVSAVTKKF